MEFIRLKKRRENDEKQRYLFQMNDRNGIAAALEIAASQIRKNKYYFIIVASYSMGLLSEARTVRRSMGDGQRVLVGRERQTEIEYDQSEDIG